MSWFLLKDMKNLLTDNNDSDSLSTNLATQTYTDKDFLPTDLLSPELPIENLSSDFLFNQFSEIIREVPKDEEVIEV